MPAQVNSDSQLIALWLHGRLVLTVKVYQDVAEQSLVARDVRLYWAH